MDAIQNVAGYLNAYDYEDITIDNTVGGKGFTAAKISPTSASDKKMGHARAILVAVETADIRYSLSPIPIPVAGGPGILAPQGSQLTFVNFQTMKDFRAIRETGVSAVLRVFYLR